MSLLNLVTLPNLQRVPESLFQRETEQCAYFGGVKDLVLSRTKDLPQTNLLDWEGMRLSPIYLLRNPFRLLHAANKGDRKEEMGNVHVEEIVVQFS